MCFIAYQKSPNITVTLRLHTFFVARLQVKPSCQHSARTQCQQHILWWIICTSHRPLDRLFSPAPVLIVNQVTLWTSQNKPYLCHLLYIAIAQREEWRNWPPGVVAQCQGQWRLVRATRKNPLLRQGKGVIFVILKWTAAVSIPLVRCVQPLGLWSDHGEPTSLRNIMQRSRS